MTINDLLEQGMTIQGPVWVGGYADEGTSEYEFFHGQADWSSSPIEEGFADREITYIFASWGELRIEVKVDNAAKS